ncbi:tetratricopeptide repeat protein [Gelidibacter gilvus]|uniref:Peptidase M48 domain-containing protein n=1 Tax=Gelidibacter gilvus TaxID=59602 RepID=A0A4Q0XCD1_9FLAO|nr:tetratricopeptide repeat protein [Gelidibacter gilvus]RXJ45591.1 hypothetical protein ESZ48_15370 [Gelidibacter gilvus]
MNKTGYVVIFLCCLFQLMFSANNNDDEEKVKEIFNKIVLAYGSPKSAPQLVFSDNEMSTPAIYYAKPDARIVVDRKFFDICKSLNEYAVDAMAIVLSHELAHYFNDHTFCSDFAFAIRNDNKDLSSKLKNLSKSEKIALETEADLKGLFYATSAGYNPFSIYEELLNKIYKFYKLENNVDGYPTKAERVAISGTAQQKIAQLYVVFQQGITAGKNGKYDEAIEKFETINRHFPTRENYNNIGAYYTLKALSFYPISRAAYLKPERFSYPLQVEEQSRLVIQKQTRGTTSEAQEIINTSLLNAQKAFEKSIALDPNYHNSFINLACVYDLLNNPEAALGTIKELPQNIQKQKRAKRISAIAYYHMDLTQKAEKLWEELGL